mmetsp:Transcript_61383/g.68741  ORF Transcript_61383/g.68741 Transcript_61383/m.68741 type:complete len:105 (-) Transcript_61383:1108-1422(-)
MTPEGREQAKQSHKVYQALMANWIVTDRTPVYTKERKWAIDTATLFTGRDLDCDEHTNTFTIDPRLLEQKLGNRDTILTDRFQKEIKLIPGFSPPAEETPMDHL